MADPQIVNTLRSKRDDVERYIRAMERKISAARHDLSHINATLRLFELKEPSPEFPVHMGLIRIFERREVPRLCLEALAKAPEGLDTRELALALIRAKGLDPEDRVLRQAMALRIVQVLARMARSGRVGSGGKRRGVMVWNQHTIICRAVEAHWGMDTSRS